ncbi:MAG: FAD-binding oxidoreductase [Chloroflexi bacterium]|nr:FAD-binding oxidoreductase [Chloroflexota bacterium]
MSLEETHIKRGVSEFSVAQLSASIKGQVITPDDAGYDKARTVFYGGIDRRPAAIVRVLDANDVSQVVAFARENDIELAVRAGGHSVAGHSVSEGGIVLDLSQMKGLDIDVKNRTAWADAGLTAGEYTTATGAHGLATGFGDTASVGIAGLTLGGGAGYLVRKYGLTIDDLLAAEIVTADGEIRHVDTDTHPDLFWAIRGGGGNFGVVTRFQYRLHEVDKVVGGILILPASPEILRSVVKAAEDAPEELSAIIAVMIAPPMPFIPAEHHGQLITMILPVYVGEVEAGLEAVAQFRAIATPLADMLRPMSYPEVYPPEQEDFHPIAAARTMFIDSVDEQATDVIFEYLGRSTAQMAVAQIRVLGGAMARVPVEATAFAHRSQPIMANVAALYQNPEDAAVHEAWAAEFAAALRQGNTGAYANFLGDEGEARVREAYPGATWERLTTIKAKYDPTNLFRLNQNIPPAK